MWTPDGQRIAFASRRPEITDKQRVFWQPADGSGDAELLVTSEHEVYPVSWSPDGQTLAFVVNNPDTQSDIWVLPLGQEPVPLLATAFLEHSPMFSPDGRWLAYVSDESGRDEVFIRSFPHEGAKHPISTVGGREPVWSRDGRKLYFRSVDNTEMWSVAVELEPTFQASRPELLFSRRFYGDPTRQQTFDISVDGERFLVVEEMEDRSREVIIVLNWSEDLKRLLPTK